MSCFSQSTGDESFSETLQSIWLDINSVNEKVSAITKNASNIVTSTATFIKSLDCEKITVLNYIFQISVLVVGTIILVLVVKIYLVQRRLL